MPSSRINLWIKSHPELMLDGNNLFCEACNKTLNKYELCHKMVKRKQSHMAFVKDGFVYHQNSRKTNSEIRYLACSEYKKLVCHARATVPVGGSMQDLVVTREHNHPPSKLAADRNMFIKQLKDCIQFTPHRPLKEIYQLIQSLNPQAAEIYTYHKMLSSMRRWKNQALQYKSEILENDILQ